jgi:hypothetical protein
MKYLPTPWPLLLLALLGGAVLNFLVLWGSLGCLLGGLNY